MNSELSNIISFLLNRDLQALQEELYLFKDEDDIWTVAGDVKNSAGNLVLHICGNLNHFVGAVVGGTGYVRERDREFSEKGIVRDELQVRISETMAMLKDVLADVDEAKLAEAYPIRIMDRGWKTGEFLIHLCTHLTYHLGQVNYIRRML